LIENRDEQDTTQVPTSLADRSAGPVSREALYEMVWFEPRLKAAARFGVSSSYIREEYIAPSRRIDEVQQT
jgi:hypothetical protein